MRWFNFGILAFITLVIQVSVARFLGLGPHNVMPDLLILLAVVLAFRGISSQVLIACWILGLVKDLFSQAPLGGYAFSFGMVALLIMALRNLLYGEHPLLIISLTFLGSFLVEQIMLVISLLRGEPAVIEYGGLTLSIFFSALFTGALAPYGQWVVVRFHRQLGLPRRRTYTHSSV